MTESIPSGALKVGAASLHDRLQALREFLSPPCANALSPPGLELLDEVVAALARHDAEAAERCSRAASPVDAFWRGQLSGGVKE